MSLWTRRFLVGILGLSITSLSVAQTPDLPVVDCECGGVGSATCNPKVSCPPGTCPVPTWNGVCYAKVNSCRPGDPGSGIKILCTCDGNGSSGTSHSYDASKY